MATSNPNPVELSDPVTTVNTTGLGFSEPAVPPSQPDALYPSGIPEPRGIESLEKGQAKAGTNTDPTAGQGVEGEVIVWEARYSNRNFIGRIGFRVLVTLGFLGFLSYLWGTNSPHIRSFGWVTVVVLGLFWLGLGFRMIQAHYSHYYRLTNRRLFVSTGMVNRRRDMMELLRVKDVFTRQQSLLERWLKLGTVVVVPSEKDLPTFYVAGVDDPKQVMDLVWHHARAERDQRSLKVENL